MGLQIRVRHALGERVIDLPERTVDEPVVVGRASSAEVQVPWATVAPKHCVLFIHEGHWAVQDLGAGGGTFVNREPVADARLLQIGDVIQVGSEGNAPTIEIDPAAAAEGRTGYAGVGLPHMQAAPRGGYGGYPAAGGYGQYPAAPPASPYPGAYPGAAQYPAAAPPQYAAAEPEYQAPDEIAYTPSVAPGYRSYRAKKSGNGGMVAVMVIAFLLVGGAVAFVLYRNANEPKVIVQKQPDIVVVKPTTSKPKGLFEEGIGTADTSLDNLGKGGNKPPKKTETPKPSGVKPKDSAVVDPRTAKPDDATASTDRPPRPLDSQTVVPGMEPKEPPKKPSTDEPGMDPVRKPAASTPETGMDPVKPPATAGEPGMDPVRRPEPAKPTGPDAENLDPAMAASWDAMKQLAENPGKESFAILRFEDFRRLNPGKFDKELDEFIDQKMDRIWWERIDQLFKKMEKLNVDIDRTQTEVFDENNLDIKKQKLAAIKSMKSDLETSTKTLRDSMGYGEANPPNLTSSAELASLAQKRDKGKYEGWKKATIFYIKSNQGRLQWMNEI